MQWMCKGRGPAVPAGYRRERRGAEQMTTLRLVPKIEGSTTVIDAFVDATTARHSIFYSFEGGVRPDPSGIGNAALVGFLPYAMQHGLDIHVDGPVDLDLLVRLEESQDAWALWHPRLFRRVRLDAAEIRAAVPPGDDSAVSAFSGGLDSVYVLHAHRRGLIGRRALDVRFAVLMHGFDLPLDRSDWFEEARRRARVMAESYGVQLVTVRTNWRGLNVPWGLSFIFGVASVLHQFRGTVANAVFAIDRSYDRDMPGWGNNAVTNHMMGGTSFPIHFTGAGLRRTEKAGAVGGERAVLENLRVCWEHPDSSGNCGRCEKCIRTKLNFLAVGIDDLPALGDPLTARQIDAISVASAPTLSFYHELLDYRWQHCPEIGVALERLVRRSTRDQSGVFRLLAKYRRSLQKRGLWRS